jgi:hypothetical protein
MLDTLKTRAMYAAGLGFLALAWAKHTVHGYSTPDTLAPSDVDGAIAYARRTVASWMRYLPGDAVRDKDVLELGPGSSLATGALMLARGARSYRAIDAFPLAAGTTKEFLKQVLTGLDAADYRPSDVTRAQAIVADEKNEAFTYEVDRAFDVAALAGGRRFDLIVSCASLEHHDDIGATIAGTSKVARSGCISAHIVDFQTHSRWIRENDPNNIYRYSDALYRLFSFPGQPNRKRPDEYVAAFECNAWRNVSVVEAAAVEPALIGQSTTGLYKRFNVPAALMVMLSGVVLAEM